MVRNITPICQRTDITILVGFGDMASVGTHKRDISVDCHCLINAIMHGRIATFGIAVLADFGVASRQNQALATPNWSPDNPPITSMSHLTQYAIAHKPR